MNANVITRKESLSIATDTLITAEKERIAPDEMPCCPICGCETATAVTKANGILGPGGMSWTLHWVCDGCSVMFKKKDKFFR